MPRICSRFSTHLILAISGIIAVATVLILGYNFVVPAGGQIALAQPNLPPGTPEQCSGPDASFFSCPPPGATSTTTTTSPSTNIANSPHCDQSGFPSCSDVGFANGQNHLGTSCPSGHSANYCSGWNAGAKVSSPVGETNIANSPHCDQSGFPSCYDVGFANGKANPGTPCPSGHSTKYCNGWNGGARASSGLSIVVPGVTLAPVCGVIASPLAPPSGRVIGAEEQATPTITVTRVVPTFPGQTDVFLEYRAIDITYSIKNNANHPISGVIYYGGASQRNSLDKLQTSEHHLSALAPHAGMQDGNDPPIVQLRYYDDCDPNAKITPAHDVAVATAASNQYLLDVAARYYVYLDSFDVLKIRASDDDQDIAALAAGSSDGGSGKANGNIGEVPQPYGSKLQAGEALSAEVENTGHPPEDTKLAVRYDGSPLPLVVGPIDVYNSDKHFFFFTYTIDNAGFDSSSIFNKLVELGANVAKVASGKCGVEQCGAWIDLGKSGASFLHPDCDGTVAAFALNPALKGDQLYVLTKNGNGIYNGRDFYAGTDSEWGCGSNSMYWASWHIIRQVPGGP